MNNFESRLCKVIGICNGNFSLYKDFERIYTFTTENVSDYQKFFDYRNKSMFTVGSSIDQVLNAYYCGARDITLYDINENSKEYGWLKIASILSLNYDEFQQFFFKKSFWDSDYQDMFSKETFNKVKSTLRLLDYESFLFFDELFSLYDGSLIRDRLFDDDESRIPVIKGFNFYLRDEESYNTLKSSLKRISFNFVNGDIFQDEIKGIFDNIFLSNLCTTVDVDKLKNLLVKLKDNNLSADGSILVGYLWDMDFDNNDYKDDWSEIYKMPIVREKLVDFITEHKKIRDSRDIIWNEDEKRDMVLIYRNGVSNQ